MIFTSILIIIIIVNLIPVLVPPFSFSPRFLPPKIKIKQYLNLKKRLQEIYKKKNQNQQNQNVIIVVTMMPQMFSEDGAAVKSNWV